MENLFFSSSPSVNNWQHPSVLPSRVAETADMSAQNNSILLAKSVTKKLDHNRVYDKKNIEIVFDFDDCYQALLTQLPAMGVEVVTDPDNNLQVRIKEVV